jgi:hypothetical protein
MIQTIMPCSKCHLSGHNVRTCPTLAYAIGNPRTKVASHKDKEPGENPCPICLEQLNNENTLTTVCNHEFCVNCAEDMYQKRIDNCPLCRKNNNHTYKERQFSPRAPRPPLQRNFSEELIAAIAMAEAARRDWQQNEVENRLNLHNNFLVFRQMRH